MTAHGVRRAALVTALRHRPQAPAVPLPEPEDAAAAADRPAPDEPVSADLEWRSLVVAAGVMAAAAVLLVLARATNDTLVHLLIAVVAAFALDRVVRLVERSTRLPRTAAVGVVLTVAVALLTLVGLLLVPAVVQQAERLGDQAPAVLDDLAQLPVVGQSLQENDVPAQVQRWLEGVPEQLTGNAERVIGTAQSAVFQLAAVITTLLMLVLLLLEGPALVAAGRRLLPVRWRSSADAMGRSAYAVIGRYAVGSVLLALLAGTAAFLIALALQVPLAPLAALWAMVWNFVPQLGGVMGGAGLVALALTEDVTTAFVVLVVWLVYMQVENRVVQPVVVGRAVQLSPLTTMVVALLGVAVAGLVGAVLAIPLVAAVNAARRELPGRR